jgi:hypothetical protein
MKKPFLLTFLFVSIISFGQSTSNKLTFRKGQVLEVTTQVTRNSKQEFMGQSMESSVSSSFTNTYTVVDASAKGASINAGVKRIKFDMNMMGQSQSFDSDKKDDLNGDIGKMVSNTLNEKYSMDVDPSGKVLLVKQDAAQKPSSQEEQAAGMMGMILGRVGNMSAPKTGDATIFKILPGRQVKKGDTWTEEDKDSTGSRKANYTITDISDKEILVDFTEEGALSTTQEMMGQEATINVNSKSNGKIILDKVTGILKQKTFETTSEERIKAAGQEIPSHSKMNTVITVKSL